MSRFRRLSILMTTYQKQEFLLQTLQTTTKTTIKIQFQRWKQGHHNFYSLYSFYGLWTHSSSTPAIGILCSPCIPCIPSQIHNKILTFFVFEKKRNKSINYFSLWLDFGLDLWYKLTIPNRSKESALVNEKLAELLGFGYILVKKNLHFAVSAM